MSETSQDSTEDVQSTEAPNLGGETQEENVETEQSTAEKLFDADTKGSDEKPETEEKTEESETEDKGSEEDKEESKESKGEEGSKDDESEKEDYSLEKPENSLLSEADMERIESYSKDQGLSKEAAEMLVEQNNSAIESFQKRTVETHREMVDTWAKQCATDKEIGGDNYAESVELAKRAVDRWGTEEFKKNLSDSGYGNHPEVVRAFARIGKAMADDTFVKAGPATVQKSVADIFYPKSN